MQKFKVGDKVVRREGMGKDKFFQDSIGGSIYYVVTSVSDGGYWLQLDGWCSNRDTHPWYVLNFELYQEQENELPPVPRSVSYLRDNGRRKLVASIDGDYVNVLLSLNYRGSIDAVGYSMEPDAALQLAHDLRRMAMEVKRKERAR